MSALICWVLLLASSAASAGYAQAIIGGGAQKVGSTYVVKGASATASNGAFTTPATVTAAGRAVTMPASASFASNAGTFAASAVRLNPAGLMVGLAATWLIGYGLDYVNGSWQKSVPGGMQYCTGSVPNQICVVGPPTQANANQACQQLYGGGVFYDWAPWTGQYGFRCNNPWRDGLQFQEAGTTPAVQIPATDQDFASITTVPDNVAQELARSDVPMPVNEPQLASPAQDFNYGDPYVDPSTGKTVQMRTRVTPDPLAGDPFRVRVESFKVDIAAAPAPVPGQPDPSPVDEQPKDPCLDNPDRLGCMNAGTPEDTPLGEYAVPFSVSPVTVGGAGDCPPDPVINVHGMSFTMPLGPICTAAGWMRPLVLALAWLSAAMIISGAVRES